MANILVCDDDQQIVEAIDIYLTGEGFHVIKAYDGAEALKLLDSNQVDLLILDVMMPGLDGIRTTLKVRETSSIPIIILSAKSEDTDKILGLNIGADDYITKPFNPLELMARVKSQLRRYKKYNPARAGDTSPAVPADTLIHGDLVLSKKAHACTLNGEAVELTPTEFSILRILLENRGTAVGAEELFHQIWKDEYYSKSNNTITVHIRHLREKLGDGTDKPKYIKTVWGVGYKIEANG